MSQFGSSSPGDQRLAGGYVELTVRGTEQVQAQVKETAAVTQGATATMATATEQSAARQNAANQSAVKGWKQFSSGITSTIASVTSLVAVLGLLTRSLTALWNGLSESNRRVSEFLKALDTADAEAGLARLQARINDLQEQSNPRNFRGLLDAIGATSFLGFETREQEIQRLQGAAERAASVIRQRREGAFRETSAKELRIQEEAEERLHQLRRANAQALSDWKINLIRQEHEEEMRLARELAEFDRRTRASILDAFNASVKALEKAQTEAARRQDAFNQRTLVAIEGVTASLDLQERRLAAIHSQWGGRP